MDKLQKMLKDACEDMGDECQFRNDYSGRGMYGSKCVGITGSWKDCQRVIASVLGTMSQDLFDTAIDCDDDGENEAYALNDTVQEQIDKLMAFTFDSMGYDVIIYWERLEPLTDDEEDLPTDAEFVSMTEAELLAWIAEHSEYHTDDDPVENWEQALATAQLMRDRIQEDIA
jgi:hypothetical protein